MEQDLPQKAEQVRNTSRMKTQQKTVDIGPNYQLIMNAKKLCPQNPIQALSRMNSPIPNINVIQVSPNQQVTRAQVPMTQVPQNLTNRVMSPLSLSIDTPMYTVPPRNYSPGISPAISPALKDRLVSPYSSPRSLSPAGRYMYSPGSNRLSPGGVLQSNSDPYLTNKVQASPTFSSSPAPIPSPTPMDIMFDSPAPITSLDFWTEADMIPDTSDLMM